MKILQIIPHYIPASRFGGPQHVAHNLAISMINQGHTVTVCTTNLADDTSDLAVPLDVIVKQDNVSVYYESTQLSRYWGFSPSLARRTWSEMQKADIVFVHAHYQFANFVGAWLARRARKPYIIFAHGSLHRQGLAHKSAWRKRLYLRLLEERNFRNALFIAFNAPEEQSLSLYADLGRVVPSGINPIEFNTLPPIGTFKNQYPELEGKTYFLFLGRLDVKHKGLDLLIPAFARLVEHETNLHLVLAGADEDGGAAYLRSLIQQYNLTNSVTLTGLITGQDKVAALQDADAFVLPSRFEGLSVALLEALYFGLPVLVTDQVGLSREIDQVGAGIVTNVNEEAIYKSLCKLADTATRGYLRGRGRELILAKYTWDTIARNLIADIGKMIK